MEEGHPEGHHDDIISTDSRYFTFTNFLRRHGFPFNEEDYYSEEAILERVRFKQQQQQKVKVQRRPKKSQSQVKSENEKKTGDLEELKINFKILEELTSEKAVEEIIQEEKVKEEEENVPPKVSEEVVEPEVVEVVKCENVEVLENQVEMFEKSEETINPFYNRVEISFWNKVKVTFKNN